MSRKDSEHVNTRHFCHSSAIAKVIEFKRGTIVLAIGTGGFPGIPLAILFPEVQFHLVDSIGKKILVVTEVTQALGLKNVEAKQMRAEKFPQKVDFVVSRAVTRMKPFCSWIHNKFKSKSKNDLDNGLLYLKGGDLEEELAETNRPYQIHEIHQMFKDEWFETKKVVFMPF